MSFCHNVIAQAYATQDGRCAMCGDLFDDVVYSADHILAETYGGDDSGDNCILLCDRCHDHTHVHGRYNDAAHFDLLDGKRMPYLHG